MGLFSNKNGQKGVLQRDVTHNGDHIYSYANRNIETGRNPELSQVKQTKITGERSVCSYGFKSTARYGRVRHESGREANLFHEMLVFARRSRALEVRAPFLVL